MHTGFTKEEFEAFKAVGRDGPIHMLNLVRVRETADWVLREMIADGGGFAATIDADSEGEEGRFYVWTADQIGEYAGLEGRMLGATDAEVTAAGAAGRRADRLARVDGVHADRAA